MQILIVDDHVLIREALRAVLREVDEDAVILEASSAGQALQHLRDNPDVSAVLLDLSLPDSDGFSTLAELRERWPAISVIILSGSNDRASIARALELGALGFIPKTGQRAVMISALRLVFAGGVYIPPQILERGPPAECASTAPVASLARSAPACSSPSDRGLTARQQEVLALMMRGKSNKAICRALDLAEPTVKNHVTAILKLLNVTNRTEAVVMVGQLGWQLPSGAS